MPLVRSTLLSFCVGYTLLPDTDFPGFDLPGSKTASVDACAQLCEGTWGCVAASWNGPGSFYKDNGCNLKCDSSHPAKDMGEIGIVITANSSTCGMPPPQPSPPPEWTDGIAHADIFFAAQEPVDNLRATIGNGFLATVVGSNAIYVAGVFNGGDPPMGDITHRARVPSTMAVAVSVTNHQVNNTVFALDIRKAVYTQRIQLLPQQQQQDEKLKQTDPEALIYVQSYAHRQFSSVGVVWIQGMNLGATSVNLQLSNQSSIPLSEDFYFTSRIASLILLDGTPSSVIIFTGHTLIPEINGTATTAISVVTTEIQNNFPFILNVTQDSILLVTAIRTSLNSRNPESDAIADYINAMSFPSPQILFDAHVQAWEVLWQAGIETDRMDVARAVNSSLYYIMSSFREDTVFSLSPGGLASNGYNGHTFWDCETWMYPSFVLLQPQLAASLLLYRFQRQPGAVSKARSYSPPFNGTMFPWESALMGVEACPPWASTGQLELHISGDIALAAKQYWEATNDMAWLKEVGYPLARGIADFWVSKIVLSPDGSAHINHVIPPDEYAIGDDSVYTNQVAIIALQFATIASLSLGMTPDPRWEQYSYALIILFDPILNIHPEYKGYAGQKIKQADVVLLGYPLMTAMSTDIRASDLRYYAKVTDSSGPAMTWGMHTIGFLEIGDHSSAASNFNRSFANSQPPFGIWTETPTGGTTNFITGAGGFLQTVLFGFGGFRIISSRLLFQSSMMEGAQTMKVRGLAYRGALFDFAFDSKYTNITLNSFAHKFGFEPKVSVTDLATNATEVLRLKVPLTLGVPDRFAIVVE